jgi:hypothetical protein
VLSNERRGAAARATAIRRFGDSVIKWPGARPIFAAADDESDAQLSETVTVRSTQ